MVVIVRSSSLLSPLLVSSILSLPSPLFLFLLHLITSAPFSMLVPPVIPSSLPPLTPFLFPLRSSLLCVPSLPSCSPLCPSSSLGLHSSCVKWCGRIELFLTLSDAVFFDFQSIEKNVFWRSVAPGVLNL